MDITKLIYAIKEYLRDYSDDYKYPDLYIKQLIEDKRVALIKEKMKQSTSIPSHEWFSNITLDLERVDRPLGRLLLKSTKPVPKIINVVFNGLLVDSVSPIDQIGRPFRFTTRKLSSYYQYENFVRPMSYIDYDNYLYVVSEDVAFQRLQQVILRACFEDTEQLKEFDENIDKNYPLSYGDADLIYKDILNELINGINIPEDKLNDGKPDIPGSIQRQTEG
jgi:hypothetical protein